MEKSKELKWSIFWGIMAIVNCIVAYVIGDKVGAKCAEHLENYIDLIDEN